MGIPLTRPLRGPAGAVGLGEGVALEEGEAELPLGVGMTPWDGVGMAVVEAALEITGACEARGVA